MRKIRLLLYPLSIIYNWITALRNFFFDVGIFKQYTPVVPTITVGNLSTGGTGKTPMIEFLIRANAGKRIGVISRGYGRSTKGYVEVKTTHQTIDVGDEPLQIKSKFKDQIVFAVCEKRALGIQKITQDYKLDLILLDDAYQHRHVKAHKSILLSSYDKLYFYDFLLPAGDLRESRSGARRADHIVITKCPPALSVEQQGQILKKIQPLKTQKVHFASISYAHKLKGADGMMNINEIAMDKITLVTGIAKPQPMLDHLQQFFTVDHLKYSDHHDFTAEEIQVIKQRSFIITTEKDYMRLKPFKISNLYYLEMQMVFLGNKIPVF